MAEVGVVANTGQETLAGSDATLAPSAGALAVSRATLAEIEATEAGNDTALAVSGADLAGSAAAALAATIALHATLGAPVAVNLLQIATVAARQRCQPTLSPLLLLIRLGCPILAPSSTLGPSPFPLDLHLAMGTNI